MKGQPFFFDTNNFDDDTASIVEEDVPEEPEFTQTQLNDAKAAAYEDGKKAGFKDSQDSIEKQNLALLQKIDQQIQTLHAAEQERSALFENEAVHLSLKIMQKLFPCYARAHGDAELEAAILAAISEQKTPDKVSIRLHETMAEQIESAVKKSDASINTLTLQSSADFNMTQAQILWDGGGLLYNHDVIAQKTFEIIKDTLAERGITVHDKEDLPSDDDAPAQDKTTDNGTPEQEKTE